MWNWISGLSGGAATFIGALTGSLVGLVALLIGALFNAHLGRKRDDRLRAEETRAIAAAIRAELAGLVRKLEEPFSEISSATYGDGKTEKRSTIWIPDIARRVKLMPEMLPKLGVLDVETIGAVIDAQIAVEEYGEYLRLKTRRGEGEEFGGEFALPGYEKRVLEIRNKSLIEQAREAIGRLDRYLGKEARILGRSWCSGEQGRVNERIQER
jgi:hypothetical protein